MRRHVERAAWLAIAMVVLVACGSTVPAGYQGESAFGSGSQASGPQVSGPQATTVEGAGPLGAAGDDPAGQTAAGATQQAAGAATAASTAGEPIKIGSIWPMSSGFSQVLDAKQMVAIVQRYIAEEINAKGGIHGRPVELVWYDDGFDPTKGVELVRKLVEQDNVLAIVDPITTFTIENAAPYVAEKGVTIIAPDGYQEVSYQSEWIYPVTNFFDRQGYRMGRYLACDLGLKRVGVWSIGAYDGSRRGGDAIVQGVEECGGTITDREDVAMWESNFTPFIVRMRGSNPDVVASAMHPLGDALMVTTAQAQNYRPPEGMMFLSAMAGFSAIAEGMGDFADGFWAVSEFQGASQNPANPKLQAFAAWAKKLGINPDDRFPLQMWAGLEIFKDAALAAGPNVDRASFKAALDSLPPFDFGFHCQPLQFRPGGHDLNPCLRIIQWDAAAKQWNQVTPLQDAPKP